MDDQQFSDIENLQLQSLGPVLTNSKSELISVIQNYKERVNDLVDEIYDLNLTKKELREHSEELQRKFVMDRRRQEQKIGQLRLQIEKEKVQFQVEYKKLTDLKNFQFSMIIEKRRNEINQINKKTEEVNAEYNNQKHIEERKTKLLNQIAALEKAYIISQYDHHDKLNKEDKKFQKQKANVISINTNSLKEIKKTAAKQAQEVVARQKKQSLQNNQKLKVQLKRLQQQIQVLRKQRASKKSESKQLFIYTGIYKEEEQVYNNVLSNLNSKISESRDKILFFKQELSAQSKIIKDKTDSYKREEQKQLLSIQQKLKAKIKDLQQVAEEMQQAKLLSDILLKQKSIVQQFFSSSIENVRKQISNKEKQKRKWNFLPNLKQKSEKVDIGELDLQNKEKILRIIYSKIMGNSRK